jgi:hydrogenase expression/formation protein HypD
VKRFHPDVEPTIEHARPAAAATCCAPSCAPDECPLFRKVCTPENPVGPCMVSSEGSCAAYYRYY